MTRGGITPSSAKLVVYIDNASPAAAGLPADATCPVLACQIAPCPRPSFVREKRSARIVFVGARNRKGTCAYCGEEKKLTRDHVPPRIFFAKPCPEKMLVVPACADCNFRYKSDDEYTRAALALDVRAASHRDVIGSLSTLLRSLQYLEGRKFAHYLGRNTNPAIILGANGAPVETMTQDRTRLNVTGEHLTRGLYFVEKRRPIRKDADLRIEHQTGLDAKHPDMPIIANAFSVFPQHRDGAVGHAFSYAAAFGSERSVWLMMLYDYFFWIATIDERDVREREADTPDAPVERN